MLENVAFYMGNLQVIKDSRGREWISSGVSLGALIRNGMGILLWLLFLYVFFYDFHELLLMRFYDEALVPKNILDFRNNSAAKY